MKKARVVTAGGASHVATLAGALFALDKRVEIVGVGGTSAGALASIGLAFGVPAEQVFATLRRLLKDNRVLDKSIRTATGRAGFDGPGFGLCRWDTVREAIRDMIGPGKRMRDAEIPLFVTVVDTYTRRGRVISSWDPATRDVFVDEAGAATAAVWPLAAMQPIPSLGTGNRLYADGGFWRNYPIEVFEHAPESTIGLRLVSGDDDGEPDVTPVRSHLDASVAMLEAMLHNASTPNTRRADFTDVAISSIGSGFDFDLTDEEIRARWFAGRRAALDVDLSRVL